MDPEVLARFEALSQRLGVLEKAVLPQSFEDDADLDPVGENKAVEGDDA